MEETRRFLQIFTFYDAYLREFYSKWPDLHLAPYAFQQSALKTDGFGGLHLLAPHFASLNYEADFIIANGESIQRQWAIENGIPNAKDIPLSRILEAQIERAKPDIIYCLNPLDFDSGFFQKLSWKPKLLIGWRAAPIPNETDWSSFDLILSHLSVCREAAPQFGARKALPFHPGVSRDIAEAVRQVPKMYDVVFTGQWSNLHTRRNSIITALCQAADQGKFSLGLFLCTQGQQLPDEVARFNRGARWGMDMYRALKMGRIIVNAEIDMAHGEAGNLRFFETTSVGSFLLTEHQSNIEKYLQFGTEVESFSSQDELISKILYFLVNPEEREAIAHAGQQRALRDYPLQRMAQQLHLIINEHLTSRSQVTPEDINRMISQAARALAEGNTEFAFQIIEEARLSNQIARDLEYVRALCLSLLRRPSESQRALEREVSLFPDNNEAKKLLLEMRQG
jgi:hypothetical protein